MKKNAFGKKAENERRQTYFFLVKFGNTTVQWFVIFSPHFLLQEATDDINFVVVANH